MAIGNYGLPFNLGNAQKRDLRDRPSRLAVSDIRNWRFEQSEGIRPAEYFAPYKYLPVGLKDVTTEDYVVLPKGRIVSALSSEDTTVTGGLVYPVSSGSIYTGYQASELGGAAMTAKIDESYYGYDDFIAGLLVLANGGTISSGYYTTSDVAAGTWNSAGTLVAANDAFTLPANAPVGCVYHDWYQDIRGKHLNYRMHADGGHVLTDWYVEVPYVYVSNTGGYSGVNPQYINATYANLVSYWAVNQKFTYLTVDTVNSNAFRIGTFVTSDLLGNFAIQGNGSVTTSRTCQTVGKLVAIDNRFPKGGLEDVLTYPGSGMPGNQTAGLPKILFDFVYECIKAGVSAPTVEGVYDAVRSGSFGLARIKLLIA